MERSKQNFDPGRGARTQIRKDHFSASLAVSPIKQRPGPYRRQSSSFQTCPVLPASGDASLQSYVMFLFGRRRSSGRRRPDPFSPSPGALPVLISGATWCSVRGLIQPPGCTTVASEETRTQRERQDASKHQLFHPQCSSMPSALHKEKLRLVSGMAVVHTALPVAALRKPSCIHLPILRRI